VRARVATMAEAQVVELRGDAQRTRLVAVGDGDEDGALARQAGPGRCLRLGEGSRKSRATP